MNDNKESYGDMVQRLVKDPVDILDTLTPEAVDLWHMATGVTTEVGELFGAVVLNDHENTLEELGDIQFYCEGYVRRLNAMGSTIDSNHTVIPNNSKDHPYISTAMYGMAFYAAELLDGVGKKLSVYNDPVKANLQELELRYGHFRFYLSRYEQYEMPWYSTSRHLNPEGKSPLVNAKDRNQRKLSTGKNARYKQGYSDKAAHNRADKEEKENNKRRDKRE